MLLRIAIGARFLSISLNILFVLYFLWYTISVVVVFYITYQTGTTALFFAAQGGFLEIVKELLEEGAQNDLPSQVISTLEIKVLASDK